MPARSPNASASFVGRVPCRRDSPREAHSPIHVAVYQFGCVKNAPYDNHDFRLLNIRAITFAHLTSLRIRFMRRIAKFLLAFSLAASAQACIASYEQASEAYSAKDFARALELARPLAESGHAGAQYLLALLYRHGRGVARDDVTAANWFAKAVEGNHANAMNDLATMHRSGEGVAQDDTRAFELLKRSAALGAAAGQFNFGKMFEHGIATTKDPLQARYWYERSDATRYEQQLKAKGRDREVLSNARRVLAEECKPKTPPTREMNRLRIEKLTGNIDFYIDGDGKARGVREDSISHGELRFEAVALFSQSLRAQDCRFDEELRESAMRIPFTFELK
jgi:TPR repeat protein